MVINNYNLPCQYHLGQLENILYLQPFDENISYHIDSSGQPYCDLISGTIYTIDCKSIQLTEDSNFDGNRFNFKYTLSFTITEGLSSIYTEILEKLKYNRYRAIVKTKEGMYYLVNAEFPYTISYKYIFGSSDDCSVTFECLQNIPTMKVTSFDNEKEPLINKDCTYCKPYVNEFEIIEYEKAVYSDESKQFYKSSGSTWYSVVPLGKSFIHNSSYSDGNLSDTVEFEIELGDYLTTFHYNLIEFSKNKYTVRYKTSHNNWIIVDNLFPSFSLYTSESNSSLNKIKITLRRNGDFKLYSKNGSISDIIDSSLYGKVIYEPTIDIDGIKYPTMDCISKNVAKMIILKESYFNGYETGMYYVLDGYESYFTTITDKIREVVSEERFKQLSRTTPYLYTTLCEDGGCIFSTTLNKDNFIINGNIFDFVIYSKYGWSVKSYDSCLSFNRISGSGEQDDNITISSTCETNVSANFVITVCDTDYYYTLKKKDTSSCFISSYYSDNGEEKETDDYAVTVNCLDHILKFNLESDNAYIKSIPDGITANIEGRTLTINVPRRNDDDYQNQKWFEDIQIETFDDERICSLTIFQNPIYVWYVTEYDNFVCSGTTKYFMKRLYSGVTADNINTPTDITEIDLDHYQLNSNDCIADVIIKWVDTDDYYCMENYGDTIWSASTTSSICENYDKYSVEYLMYYTDGDWHKVTPEISRMGNIIEKNSVDCGATPERIFRWTDIVSKECDGVALYGIKYQEFSDDNGTTWIRTATTTRELISENTVDCGGSGCTTSGETIEKWEDDKTEMYCDGLSLRYRAYKFQSCNSGITWEKTSEFSAGTVISEISPTCKSGQTEYKWEEDESEIVCGDDKKAHIVEYQYKSTDGGDTWNPTGERRLGRVIEGVPCEECVVEDNWIQSTDTALTVCSGVNEYYGIYHYWSDDCWKTKNLIVGDEPRIGTLYKEHSDKCVETEWRYVGETCGDDLPENTEIIEGN